MTDEVRKPLSELLSSSFKPVADTMNSWNKMNTNMFESFNSMFAPYRRNKNDQISEMVTNGSRLYAQWIEDVDTVIKKCFEIGRQSLSGQDIDAESFIDVISEIIEKQNGLGVISSDGESMESILKKMFQFGMKSMKLTSLAKNKANDAFSGWVFNGAPTIERYKEMIDVYDEMARHMFPWLGYSDIFFSYVQGISQDALQYAEDNVDETASFIEGCAGAVNGDNMLGVEKWFNFFFSKSVKENQSSHVTVEPEKDSPPTDTEEERKAA